MKKYKISDDEFNAIIDTKNAYLNELIKSAINWDLVSKKEKEQLGRGEITFMSLFPCYVRKEYVQIIAGVIDALQDVESNIG